MTAYIVILREQTTDPLELALYREKAPLARIGHALEPIAFYGSQDVLEGPSFEGAAILSFPTMDAARAWYNSAEYQAARRHRLAGSESRVFLIEGIQP